MIRQQTILRVSFKWDTWAQRWRWRVFSGGRDESDDEGFWTGYPIVSELRLRMAVASIANKVFSVGIDADDEHIEIVEQAYEAEWNYVSEPLPNSNKEKSSDSTRVESEGIDGSPGRRNYFGGVPG